MTALLLKLEPLVVTERWEPSKVSHLGHSNPREALKKLASSEMR